MLDKKTVINEKSVIPISLLCVIISALVLGVIHVQSISSTAHASHLLASSNQAEISGLQDEDKEIRKEFSEIKTSLARIEGALGIKK